MLILDKIPPQTLRNAVVYTHFSLFERNLLLTNNDKQFGGEVTNLLAQLLTILLFFYENL